MLDNETRNWTITFTNNGALKLDDWFVSWVKIKTNASDDQFTCVVNALLNHKWIEIKQKMKKAVGSRCYKNGKFIVVKVLDISLVLRFFFVAK